MTLASGITRKDSRKAPPEKKSRTIKSFFERVMPIEFVLGPWYSLFWRRLLTRHKYFTFATSRDLPMRRRFMRWIILMGRLLNLIIFNTLVFNFLVDGSISCDAFSTEASCLAPKSFGVQDHVCAWDSGTGTCSYSAPADQLVSAVIVVLFAIIIAVPFDALVGSSNCNRIVIN